MINARIMYHRPGNLFQDFVVEEYGQVVTETGRVAQAHKGDGSVLLRGCLSEASNEDRTNHSQKEHVVTHTVVQRGAPVAKRGDKLILTNRRQRASRSFYVVDVDEVGSLGIATIYYAEERLDVR